MKIKYALLAALLTALLLMVYYWFPILNANSISYGIYGDGYKNYYTLAYYLQNDHGAHFTGMNYPYGENVLFTDNQPVMAWMLKALSQVYPGIAFHIHGFITYMAFFSIVVAAFFIMLSFAELNLNNWYAIIFTALIALLSPQLMRVMGHFSLSYNCFVPVLLYLLIKYFKGPKQNKYFTLIVSWTTFFSFVHLYFMAMGCMFIMLSAAGAFFKDIKKLKQTWPFIGRLVLAGLLPFIALKTYLFITDPIKDRPSAPFGFLEYNSSIYDIVLSQSSFTGEVAGKVLPAGLIHYSGEGMGYIGFIPVLCMLALPFIALVSFLKKKHWFSTAYPLYILLPAAFMVLLFAMAFPFSLDIFEKYYVLLPSAIKQFRALGRLSWVFYFTSSVFSVWMLLQLYSWLYSRKKLYGHAVIIAIIAIWFADVNMVSVRYARRIKEENTLTNETAERNELIENLKTAGRNTGNFQAILPLPIFLNGSEKLYLESNLNLDAMKASLYTGLPIACGQMSRTSEHQTFEIARLQADEYLAKDIVRTYPNNQPLLVMYSNGELNQSARQLLSKAAFLFKMGDISYYELPLAAFTDKTDEAKAYFTSNKPRLIDHGGGLFSTDSINHALYLNFDATPFNGAVFGKGAHDPTISNTCLFFDTLPNGIAGTTYTLSVWAYSDSRRPAFSETYVTQVDTAGKDIAYYTNCGKFSYNTFGKWVMCQLTFTLAHAKNKIYVATDPGYNTYDELMIRPSEATVITHIENDSVFMLNNYPIR